MSCLLNEDQRQGLRVKIVSDFLQAVKSGEAFDINAYIKSMYTDVKTATQNEALAIDVARLIPAMAVNIVAFDSNLKNAMRTKGLTLSQLDDLEVAFDRDITEVQKVVGDITQIVDQLDAANQISQKEQKETEVTQEVPEDKKKEVEQLQATPVPSTQVQVEIPIVTDDQFSAVASNFLRDADFEALSTFKTLRDGTPNPNYNVPNPNVAFYYKVKRAILNQLLNRSDNSDSSEMDYPGVGPIYLTVMSTKKLEGFGKERLREGFEIKESVVLVITDSAGNIVEFDNDATAVEQGKGRPAYYLLQNTDNPKIATEVNGQIVLGPSSLMAVDSLVRETKVSREEAEATVKLQLTAVKQIRNFILNNTEKNTLRAKITSGSLGHLHFDYKLNNKLSELVFDTPFNPSPARENNPFTGEKRGRTYFMYEGTHNTAIEIERPTIPQDIAEIIASLIADDLQIQVGNKTIPISAADRQRLVEQYIMTGSTIGLPINKETGVMSVNIRETFRDVTTPEGKAKVKQLVIDALTETMPNRSINKSEIKNRKVIPYTKTLDVKTLPLNSVLQIGEGSDAQYWLVEPIKLQINKKILQSQPGTYEDVTIENGVVTLKDTSYRDFIKDNFLFNYEMNGQKKLAKLNAYFTFEVLPEEFSKMTPKVEKSVAKSGPISAGLKDTLDQVRKTYVGGKQAFLPDVMTGFEVIDNINANMKRYHGGEVTAEDLFNARNYFPKGKPLYNWLNRGYEHMTGKTFEQAEGQPIDAQQADIERRRQADLEFINTKSGTETRRKFGNPEHAGIDQYFDSIRKVTNAKYDAELAALTQGTTQDIVQEVIDNPGPTDGGLNGPRAVDEKSVDDLLKESFDDPELKKNLVQKETNLKATKEQIAQAKLWYEQHPMSKVLPFEDMMKIFNTKDPDAVATFSMNGIRLYMGSDFTDLYHEAWHGFTQMFMTKDQKKALYNETRKMEGSFTNYNGQRVAFAVATDLEIEEYLAEDFRKYMLSGGKKEIAQPVKKSIFQKILAFLKALFSDMTMSEVAGNEQAISTIHTLYDKLRVGNLAEYTFTQQNRNFNTLNKGIQAIKPEPGQLTDIGYEDSKMLVDTMDSLFSQWADALNAGLDTTQQNELAKIDAKIKARQTLTDEERDLYNTLKGRQTYKYTTLAFKTENGLRRAYLFARMRLAELHKALVEKSTQDLGVQEKAQLTKQIQTLEFAVKNFGDVENLGANRDGKGLIGYHQLKSKYLPLATREAFFEGEFDNEDETYVKGREGHDRLGNESSLKDLASEEVLYLLRGLHETNKDGSLKLNNIGVPELVKFDEVWNRLARLLQNTMQADVMYQKLVDASKGYAPYRQLLRKLGPVNNQTQAEFHLWTNFWQTFNKTRVPLIQMNLDTTTLDESGQRLDKFSYTIKIGEASAEHRKVGLGWKSYFKTAVNHPYIKADDKNNRYLDVASVLQDFPYKTMRGRELEFFHAIGVLLDNKPEIIKALQDGDQKTKIRGKEAQVIRERLYQMHEKGLPVTSLDDIFEKDYDEFRKEGKFGHERTNFTRLQILQARYSDQHSNFMVTNAEGNTQFEHSLNNTLTVMVNSINDARDYQDLISLPYMNHLDIDRNPFAKASVWLNSIFHLFNPDGTRVTTNLFGQKRKESDIPTAANIEIKLTNLSGIALFKDGISSGDGIASASADPTTKLIMDMHMTLLNGMPELMRHADKGTSFAATISRLNTKGAESSLYIDTKDFFNEVGQDRLNTILYPHISAELERVNIMKKLKEDGIQDFDFKYLEAGQEFVTFDDVLSNKTKKVLYKLSTDQTLLELLNSNTAKAVQIRALLENDIAKYFNEQYQNTNKLLDKSFMSTELIDKIRGDGRNIIGQVNDNQIREVAVKSFVTNSWIHNIESLAMFYGDLALYNHTKEEFHKRNAGFGSTGTVFRADQAALNYVNNLLNGTGTMTYARSKGLAPRVFDGSLNTAVVQDNEIGSSYYKEYVKAIGTEAAAAYQTGKMNEGDAQGWISFDSYRNLAVLEGNWSNAQESLYQQIVKGEKVDPKKVLQFFPTRKFQYMGPMATKGLPIMAFHKFSLFPLIPSVIKGTNLEKLHDKMTREGIDYALFQSGSKVGTITKDGTYDKLYTKTGKNRTIDETPFTKNQIFSQFLKNQLEIAPEYKGKVIFSTQLRKLIEDGLMENGVPTDYKVGESKKARILGWNKIKNTPQAIKESKRYALLKTYEDNIVKLTELKKKELLDEAGWKIVNGKPVGDLKNLMTFVSKELERQDISEHELDFIQVVDGKLKHDLSLSLSAEKIEKMLNAIVTRRLIKQKVNGEGLIQVSGAGFESLDSLRPDRDYENPTADDLKKWGSNDLPTYHKKKDGSTAAMKVKIALQGNFEKLLNLPDTNGQKINTIDRLNAMLKSEEWLNTGDNRRMITMVGVRIPVQGLNSMEFMEVYEFLPVEAGNIIIPPAEIVAKSGSDFDIDKLTVMMPSITYRNGEVSLQRQFNEKEARGEYELYKKFRSETESQKGLSGEVLVSGKKGVSKTPEDITAYTKLIAAIFNTTPEQLDQDLQDALLEEGKMMTFEQFDAKINGTKAIENDLIWNIKQILELPENYANLIRPNGTDLVQPLAEDLADDVMDFNPKSVVHDTTRKATVKGKEKSVISPTRVLEIPYNLYKHSSNNVGKQTLGLGAVDNTYNTIFNRIGAYMLPEVDGKSQTIRMAHNTMPVEGTDLEGISLSDVYGQDGNRISDIISQMINGWVDVAKDAWIFHIQGNKEVSPTLLFMIQAGVPLKEAVYMVSNPIVREYVKEMRLSKSTFAEPLGKAAYDRYGNVQLNWFRSKAQEAILTDKKFGFDMTKSALMGREAKKNIEAKTTELLNTVLGENGQFAEKGLKSGIKDTGTYTDDQRAVFLHFLQLEKMATAIRDVKLRMNFDTSKSDSLFDAQNRTMMVQMLREDARLPETMVENILNDSPIKAFYIQPFQIALWKDLFKLRYNSTLNEFVEAKMRGKDFMSDVKNTFGDAEKFTNELRNDLMSFIFQNSVRAFDIDTVKGYKGLEVDDTVSVESVPSLRFGAFVKESNGKPILYVDKKTLKLHWFSGDKHQYSTEAYWNKLGLAPIPKVAFESAKEFYKFVFERESLRYMYPLKKVMEIRKFKDQLAENIRTVKLAEGQTQEQHEKEMTRRSYEEWLRDRALDNTNNGWKLFKSDNTFADQFLYLKNNYPELVQNFTLVKSLAVSEDKQFKNLRLQDTSLDTDLINLFHENLLKLANPTEIKVQDPVANREISEFFTRFGTVAFLQSGLSTKSSFSMTRIVPQSQFLAMMEEPTKAYGQNMNPVILDIFYDKFTNLNSKANRSTRVRYKNYTVDTTLGQSVKTWAKYKNAGGLKKYLEDKVDKPKGEIYREPFALYSYRDKKGIMTYSIEDTKVNLVDELVSKNPDTIFVYNSATTNPNQADVQDFPLSKTKAGNTLGLPTRKGYGIRPDNQFTDADFATAKQLIDEQIVQLLAYQKAGNPIAFNEMGYGQYMIGGNDKEVYSSANPANAVAPRIFEYLSTQLFKNFGYINRNFETREEGRRVIQEGQPITDQMVRDMLEHCFS